MDQLYDLPLEELQVYKPTLTKRPDFHSFWQQTLNLLQEVPIQSKIEPYDYPVRGVKVYRITFIGYNHAEIQGWLAVPESDKPVPGLVCYHGYNYAMDGLLHETVQNALNGYAVLQMLCRGQQGYSVDNIIASQGFSRGWMTKGILNKDEYYYRAVYMDAIRALEVIASLEAVDADRIGVMGGSQGGALAIVAAALSPIVKVVIADYPYLANFRRAIDVVPEGPYLEINEYFRHYSDSDVEEKAMETLSYFDVMNHAPNVHCHTRVNIGLIDRITPPSTLFAVYNHLGCSKDLGLFRYFGHEYIPGAVEPKWRTLMSILTDKEFLSKS